MERVQINKFSALVIIVSLLLLGGSNLYAASNGAYDEQVFLPIVDVSHDLVELGIYDKNATPDRHADHTGAVQAAIDYVSNKGGGIVYLPRGQYFFTSVSIPERVTLTGIGPDKTIVRSMSSSVLINMHGGSLMNATLYGTRPEGSGENWKIGQRQRGGTATAAHNIAVRAAGSVTIDNVHSLEARYDPLYVRDVKGLRVSNSRFDRAGRNVVSIVGNTEDFIFTNCYFGSYWGLYHVDLEPHGDAYYNNGSFINCVFDGSKAGDTVADRETGTWGSFLCFTGHSDLKSHNVSVIRCEFHNIYVRINHVFSQAKFINNIFYNRSAAFHRVRTNPIGEFKDIEVRDNKFFNINGMPSTSINSGAAFTGKSTFVDNYPSSINTSKQQKP